MNICLLSVTSSSTVDNILQLIGLILLFIFVLAATYFTARFVGKTKLGQLRNRNFEVIETYRINTNQFLQLIRIGTKYVVVAVGKQETRLILELSEDEIEKTENVENEKYKFSDIITKLQKKELHLIHDKTEENTKE